MAHFRWPKSCTTRVVTGIRIGRHQQFRVGAYIYLFILCRKNCRIVWKESRWNKKGNDLGNWKGKFFAFFKGITSKASSDEIFDAIMGFSKLRNRNSVKWVHWLIEFISIFQPVLLTSFDTLCPFRIELWKRLKKFMFSMLNTGEWD